MHWVYLSPHFDDVALSCGGWVWEQAQAGEQVEVWTICAGDPPETDLSPFAQSLHARWETEGLATAQRRQEDIASCTAMQAAYRHFSLPDCIYRRAPGGGRRGARSGARSGARHLYASEEAIFGPLDPAEDSLVESFSKELRQALPEGAVVVCPLGLGGHVDHRLTRSAAERLGRPLWFYADYPYALKAEAELAGLEGRGCRRVRRQISAAGLAAWQAAIAAHASQISTFWPDLEIMRTAIRQYYENEHGVTFWQC